MDAAINHPRMPVDTLATFDAASGGRLERLIFNHRPGVLLLCLALTALFAGRLRDLEISVNLEKTLPLNHPYVRNYLENKAQLRAWGDTVRIVVEHRNADIFDRGYLDELRRINDEVFLLPGVDRTWMKSIWTPTARWTEATEEGSVGGPVMPQTFDGSEAAIEALRLNIARAGLVGSLVANDYRSSAIVVPLLDHDGEGRPLDLHRLASSLEAIRQRHEANSGEAGRLQAPVRIYISGYAKLAGDLLDGMHKVVGFFAVAAALSAAILLGATRSWRSTALLFGCSIVAVVWQLGLLAMLDCSLNPFSVLIPFLVFAIGLSHGTQKMNGILQDMGRGASRGVAARLTFRRLFAAGLLALLADAVGFAVLMSIAIPVIRELALAASLGVLVLIFTNLVLLPVLLTYIGPDRPAASRQPLASGASGRLQKGLEALTERRWATVVVVIAAALAFGALAASRQLQVGDLDPGAPELRVDSRYNRDNAYIAGHYGASSDVFAVLVKTPREQCGRYETLIEMDRLAWTLVQLPGVQKVESLVDTIRAYTAGSFDGNPKWQSVSSDQRIIDSQLSNALSWKSEFLTPDCALTLVVAYLADHKAATLARVAAATDRFAMAHDRPDRRFLPAAGNAGIEAATNVVVQQSNLRLLVLVYAAVGGLCFIAFRSWRAVVVAVVPLMLTSLMAEALMVWLGIGLKVATLPVMALGVGIGVDYSLYLLSVQLAHQRSGASLREAHRAALSLVGRVVALVGITLAAGVVTWAWSPVKFQADMGVLLGFMFLWNMVAALTLVPALSHFFLRGIGPQSTAHPLRGTAS